MHNNCYSCNLNKLVSYSLIQEETNKKQTNKQTSKTGEKAREQVPYQSAEESPIFKAC